MDQFIDNLAKELAKPTSRRGVMRLLGGAMFGGLVAAWRPASLEARQCSPVCTGKKATCCSGGTGTPFCITTGKVCCKNTKCKVGDQCCTTTPNGFCAAAGTQCCGSKACKTSNGETCCVNACCSAKQVCQSGKCVTSKAPLPVPA